MFHEINTTRKRPILIFIGLLFIGLSAFSQEQADVENRTQDSIETIVEKVIVKFDFSKRRKRLNDVYRDSVNLAKMNYLYEELHSDLDLRLRIDVYRYTWGAQIAFDRHFAGAQDLRSYLKSKDVSALNPYFFDQIDLIDITDEQFRNGDFDRLEFILFKENSIIKEKR
ncbi:MAG: hypothetical protein ACRBG0_24530 [Lewinella sp.]|uniref:hypothetical protein n=1 Tax=Lewinella sp. TaxID=2004506 RepID=UPI003D6B36F9